jgi:fluoride exporter
MNVIWIGIGGACGTIARYLFGLAAQRLLGSGFPFGTMAINALGSFLLGVVMYVGLDRNALSPELRTVLGTGVLGGFTTYSTFNLDTLTLFQRGFPLLAAANLIGTVVLCLLAGALGLAVARWSIGA